MQIIIDNGTYSCHNLGDISMLQVTVSRLREHFPHASFHVLTEDPDKLHYHVPESIPFELGLWNHWRTPMNFFGGFHRLTPKSLNGFLIRYERELRIRYPFAYAKYADRRLRRRGMIARSVEFLHRVDKASAIIADGGGYVTDSFERHAESLLEFLALGQTLKKVTAMFGQGLGPINSRPLRDLAKRVLRNIDLVSLREGIKGPSILADFGVKQTTWMITGDDAIELSSRNDTSRSRTIGFNLRMATYSSVGPQNGGDIANVVKSMAYSLGASVSPLPITISGSDCDLESLRDSLNLSETESCELSQINSPRVLAEKVGLCKLVVTGAYHAAVFALAQGIPAVCLVRSEYYEDKFAGLREQFGQGCFLVSLKNEEWERELRETIIHCWLEGYEWKEHLIKSASRQVSASNDAYGRFKAIVLDRVSRPGINNIQNRRM